MTKQPSIEQRRIHFSWKSAVIVVLSLTVLIKLGFWQLDRARQKQQMQTQQQQRKQAAAKPIERLATANPQHLNYQRVRLVGRYLSDKSIYISNTFYQGKPGFEAMVPFKLKSNAQIVLLSRGWIALPAQAKQLPSGEQTLLGSIHLPPKQAFFLAEKVADRNWPIRLHHFDMNTITQLLQTPSIPYLVRLEPDNPGSLQAFWPTPNFNASNSTAYAVQWFIMALIVAIVAIVRSTTGLKRRNI